MKPEFREVFDIVGIMELFRVFTDEMEAMAFLDGDRE